MYSSINSRFPSIQLRASCVSSPRIQIVPGPTNTSNVNNAVVYPKHALHHVIAYNVGTCIHDKKLP